MADKPVIIDVGVSTREAIQGITQIQKQITTRMKAAEKSTKALDKGVGKFIKQLSGARKQAKGIQELNKQYVGLEDSISAADKAMKDMIKRGKGASAERRNEIAAEIKALKKLSGADKTKKGQTEKAMTEMKESAADLFDLKGLIAGAEEAGDSLAEPLKAVFAKDAPRFMKDMISKFSAVTSRAAGGLSGAGAAMSGKGAALKAKGGAGAAAAGMGLKGLGAITKGLGSMVGMFAKLGPILQVASTFMMSFVQMMIDAESAAKEYNKTLLSSTGSGEFLAGSFGDIDASSKALGDSLRAARDGAMDLSMVQWGISKDAAVGFQAALGAQGISLKRLGSEMEKATGYAQSHAKVIQMGVAYSRSFGVSLDEISQAQGDMMADIGMGLDQVQASFSLMQTSAEDAGMAANKFFGIIRSFSADMNLFALRMEDVTKVMTALAKTMDPRDAQKFMSTLSQKFSGGMLDNLRHTAIAGPAAKKAVQRDLGEKKGNLKTDLQSAFAKMPDKGAKAIAELTKIIEDPKSDPRKIAEWEAKHGDKLNGSLKGAIQDTFNMQKMAQQGQEGQAAVLDQLSPLNKMAVTMGEIKSVTGKGLSQLNASDLLAIEGANIATAQEVRSYKKLEASLLGTQEELKARISKVVESGAAASVEDQAALAKLGVAINANGTVGEDQLTLLNKTLLNDKDFSKTWGTLTKDQQTALSDSAKQIDYQEQTAGFQTSALDKLGIIADILMNQIYNVMTGIWDAVLSVMDSIPGLGDGGKGRALQKASQTAAKDPALARAIAMGGGDLSKAKTNAIEGPGKQAIADIQKAAAEYRDLQAKVGTEGDPDKKKGMEARMKELAPAVQYAGVSKGAMYDQGATNEGAVAVIKQIADMREALNKAGIKSTTPAPAAAPGTPAAASAPAAPAAVAAAAAATDEPPTAEQQVATTDGVQDLHKDLRNKGIKLDTGMLNGPYSKAVEDAVYNGSAKALFEYYMYSGLDRNAVATALKSGVSQTAIRQGVVSGEAPEAVLGKLQAQAGAAGTGQANASGGMVTGIAGNLAKVASFPPAPPGEGWASVGPGETISPAGGRGGGGGSTKVELELKGDLRRFINARVVEGAAQFERNKRTR